LLGIGVSMIAAAEYREYAHECVRWAAEAESEEMRAAFLAMAQQWMEAALRIDGVIAPDKTENRYAIAG
jgi:hypothetical protein